MSQCPYCNKFYESIVYQARSADEGGKTIQLCDCILDMKRAEVSLSGTRATSVIKGVKSPEVLRITRECVYVHSPGHSEVELSFTSPYVEAAFREMSRNNAQCTRGRVRTQSIAVSSNSKVMSGVLRTRYTGEGIVTDAKVTHTRVYVAPNIVCRESTEWIINDVRVDDSAKEGEFVRYTTREYTGFTVDVTRTEGQGEVRFSIEVEIDGGMERATENVRLEAMKILLLHSGYNHIRVPWERTIVTFIQGSKARAYDGLVPEKSGEHYYLIKADGERCIASLHGSLWIFTDASGTNVLGYRVSKELKEITARSWVLDIEATLEGKIILLDVFSDADGNLCEPSRTYPQVVEQVKSLKSLDLHVRTAHDTLSDALEDTHGPIACDGVMAMNKLGMTCIKVKDQRAVELRTSVRGDNVVLSSEDGRAFYTMSKGLVDKLPIVELRLVRVHVPGEVKHKVVNILPRPDKARANRSDAIKDILMSSEPGYTSAREQGKLITDKCFSVRRAIYNMVVPTRFCDIVVDVGSGRGQSLDLLFNKQNVRKVILVEPDESRATLICHKYGLVSSRLEGLTTLLDGLYRAKAFKVVVNCALAELVHHSSFEQLIPKICAVTCSFSLNYVLPEVRVLSSIGVKVFGCCYVYDNVVNGVLVDSGAISMRLSPEDTGVGLVKWDNDEFSEPAITTTDLKKMVRACKLEFPYPNDPVLKHLVVLK